MWSPLGYNAPLNVVSSWCDVDDFVYQLMSVVATRLVPGDGDKLKIVSFNLKTEVFELRCPDEVRYVNLCTPELTNYRDSLALLDEWCCNKYHIWVMSEAGNDKSWKKLFSVDLEGLHIAGFSKKGLMLVAGEGNWDVSPVVEDAQVVKYVPPVPQSDWHMESYQESLVLLDEGDNLPPLPPPNRAMVGKY